MIFHLWTITYMVGAIICALSGVYILSARRESWARRALAIVFFIFAFWNIIDFINNNLGDMLPMVLVLEKVKYIVLSFVFFSFLLIPYSLLKEINKKTALILIPPTCMALFVIFGNILTEVERIDAGVSILHNMPIYWIWPISGAITMIVAYALVFMVLKDPSIPKMQKRRIMLFAVGTFISFILAYSGNIVGEVMFGLPSTSSLYATIGIAIAALPFRMAHPAED